MKLGREVEVTRRRKSKRSLSSGNMHRNKSIPSHRFVIQENPLQPDFHQFLNAEGSESARAGRRCIYHPAVLDTLRQIQHFKMPPSPAGYMRDDTHVFCPLPIFICEVSQTFPGLTHLRPAMVLAAASPLLPYSTVVVYSGGHCQ